MTENIVNMDLSKAIEYAQSFYQGVRPSDDVAILGWHHRYFTQIA